MPQRGAKWGRTSFCLLFAGIFVHSLGIDPGLIFSVINELDHDVRTLFEMQGNRITVGAGFKRSERTWRPQDMKPEEQDVKPEEELASRFRRSERCSDVLVACSSCGGKGSMPDLDCHDCQKGILVSVKDQVWALEKESGCCKAKDTGDMLHVLRIMRPRTNFLRGERNHLCRQLKNMNRMALRNLRAPLDARGQLFRILKGAAPVVVLQVCTQLKQRKNAKVQKSNLLIFLEDLTKATWLGVRSAGLFSAAYVMVLYLVLAIFGP